MASTVETGDKFRDLVCDLLRTQYPDAQVEQRLGGTKVDIVFSRHDFGQRTIYGVECKDYGVPLTKIKIQKDIRTAYEPLLTDRLIHRVLIVSRKPLGADAAAFMQTWSNASHQTYEELAQSLLGLRPYIETLSGLRATDDGDYVEARVEGMQGAAIDLVDRWVGSDSGGPGLAILGGYGQGKTSFARHLAAVYARRHLEQPTERMPILMPLGEVVHETQLEGLFGKQFTARIQAAGYQFSTLAHLNKAGRLLIILDGFDEMKHAMTAADFLANFQEFNRLLAESAKVLLLGRPNALPSDERALVFRGKSVVAGQEVLSATYAPWDEWRLALFGPDETRKLLASTLAATQKKHSAAGRFKYAPDFVASRTSEIVAMVPPDLLARPVHVQLVAQLAANPSFDLRGFNTFKLYDHFIRQMVERDTVQKQARRAIPLEARLEFQRDLAWWAWRRPGATQGCFFRHEVPATILDGLPDGHSADIEGKRNEYIVSTLTEEKETGVLFFAHRSFQEFLVAERLRLGRPSPTSHAEYSAFLTEDVAAFLRQAPNPEFILGWYETLQASVGPIGTPYLEFFASSPLLMRHLRKTLPESLKDLDTWTVCILHLARNLATEGAFEEATLTSIFTEVVCKGQSGPAACAALAMLQIYDQRLEPVLLQRLIACLLERCLRVSRSNGTGLVVHRDDADFATAWLPSSVRRGYPGRGQYKPATLEFDLSVLEKHLLSELAPKGATSTAANPFGDPFRTGSIAPVALEAAKVFDAIDPDLRQQHSAFFNNGHATFTLVSVNERKRSVKAPPSRG